MSNTDYSVIYPTFGPQKTTRFIQGITIILQNLIFSYTRSHHTIKIIDNRSLCEFNRALLAKQVWRIIRDPSSLMSQVLKSRYFKHADIIDAKLGSNPSYIWRSILWSRDLIQSGIRWRVGTGNQIKAFSDNWIPQLASGRSSRCGTNESVMVKDLISHDREWNEAVVRELFPSFEAEYILDIPLSRSLSNDLRFWKWDINGKYSVKMGYLLQIGCFVTPDTHTVNHMATWWNMIWTLNIPQKVRIFYWRACNEFFPSEMNLFKRHIIPYAGCSFCGSFEASTTHCLIFCPIAREAWKGTHFWSLLKHCRSLDFWLCGMVMKDKLSKYEFELFVMNLWAIWKDLCSMKHNSKPRNHMISLQWDESFLAEFKKARTLFVSQPRSRSCIKSQKWVKPLVGHFRMNVDAGYHDLLGRFSVAAVVRDHLGRICAASASGIRHPGSVLAAEISAVRHGLLLLTQADFHNVWVFSDSINAVQRINSSSVVLSSAGSIFSDVLELLKSDRVIKICHASRNANKVAHALAQFALSNPSSVLWGENSYPSWLMDVAISDLSNV